MRLGRVRWRQFSIEFARTRISDVSAGLVCAYMPPYLRFLKTGRLLPVFSACVGPSNYIYRLFRARTLPLHALPFRPTHFATSFLL